MAGLMRTSTKRKTLRKIVYLLKKSIPAWKDANITKNHLGEAQVIRKTLIFEILLELWSDHLIKILKQKCVQKSNCDCN